MGHVIELRLSFAKITIWRFAEGNCPLAARMQWKWNAAVDTMSVRTTTQYRLNETIWIMSLPPFTCRPCAVLGVELNFAQAHELWHSICYIFGCKWIRDFLRMRFFFIFVFGPLHQIHVDDSSTRYFPSHGSERAYVTCIVFPNRFFSLSFHSVRVNNMRRCTRHCISRPIPSHTNDTNRNGGRCACAYDMRRCELGCRWNKEKENQQHLYIRALECEHTSFACEPFVLVCALPSSRSMLQCALWMIHAEHMECHVLSRVFLFCIWNCAKAKECHGRINPFSGKRRTRSIRRNGRLIMTHFTRRRNGWIIHHWHLHSNPASTNGTKKMCLHFHRLPTSCKTSYYFQPLLLRAQKSKTSRERKKNAYEIVKWIIPRRICRRSNWSNHKHIKRRMGTKKAARTFSSIRMNLMGREWRTSQHFTAYTL